MLLAFGLIHASRAFHQPTKRPADKRFLNHICGSSPANEIAQSTADGAEYGAIELGLVSAAGGTVFGSLGTVFGSLTEALWAA